MILYFDNYITDLPFGKPKVIKDDFRSKSKIYAMPTRLAISKYTLASYSVYPWSAVLIKYQIDDSAESAEFEAYAKGLYPKAIIIKNRSATQIEYKKSLELLEQMPDNWIFYAPNSDHPLLLTSADSVDFLDRLIRKATAWEKQYPFVSIAYSHFSEYINTVRPGRLNFGHFSLGSKILEEDSESVTAQMPNGDFNSVQIVNKFLFRHWFASVDLGEQRVIRAEDLHGKVFVKDQVEIIPKIEIGAHFEGYEHMLGGFYEILSDQVPSLFIPPGFFENKVRIAFGYSDYRPGWVNINPSAKKYSFRDPTYGTDLKIGLQDIPLFWKNHIAEIDVNKKADQKALEQGRQRNLEIKNNPWSFKNKGLNIKTLRFRIKRLVLPYYGFFNRLSLVYMLKKISRVLGFY